MTVADAACAGMDVNVFVVHIKPHNTGAADTRLKLAKALAICHTCPSQHECLEEMLAWPDPPRDIVIANMEPRQARRAWLTINHIEHRYTTRTT